MAIRKILIVDDLPIERHMLSTILTGNGYRVIMAGNGKQAMIRARDAQPDLVLMDVVMPGINGFQAVRMFAGINPYGISRLSSAAQKDRKLTASGGCARAHRIILSSRLSLQNCCEKISRLN